MKFTGENRSTWEKTCPSATLSTTNPTWTDPESKPGARSERPTTNRLSHGTALPIPLLGSFLSTVLITRLLCMDFYAIRCYNMKARLEAY
jgi:hypothetical protein